jgi:hypothetical protein
MSGWRLISDWLAFTKDGVAIGGMATLTEPLKKP